MTPLLRQYDKVCGGCEVRMTTDRQVICVDVDTLETFRVEIVTLINNHYYAKKTKPQQRRPITFPKVTPLPARRNVARYEKEAYALFKSLTEVVTRSEGHS